MSGIEVLSRTQRIIVLPNTSVSIVKAGPAGPRGAIGPMGPQGFPGIDGDDGVSPTIEQHAPDAPHTEGDTGVLSLVIRQDADESFVDEDGDYTVLQADSDGKLKVSGPLTDEQLRATPVPVEVTADITGTFTSDGLTDTQLRAAVVETGIHGIDNSDDWNAIYGATTDSDGFSPGVPSLFVLAQQAVFDGTNWNRARGSVANGIEVDVTRLPAVTLDAASLAALENVTITIDAGSLASLETINVANVAGTEFAEDAPHTTGDAGTVALAIRHDADTSTVSADGDYSVLHVDSTGKLKVTGGTTPASTGAATDVANAVADGSVLAANANRKGASIFNDDTFGTGATAHIALGFTASATAFTAKIPPQGLYELPANWTGTVRRYSTAATGTLRVTELT